MSIPKGSKFRIVDLGCSEGTGCHNLRSASSLVISLRMNLAPKMGMTKIAI